MTTTTLPATLREIPAAMADFKVSSLKQLNTYDGVAFTATLRCRGKIIGTLQNDGHGGGTYFYPKTAADTKTWPNAIDALPNWEEPVPDLEYTLTCDEPGIKSEMMAEVLVNEYEEARFLNSKLKKHGVVVRRPNGEIVAYRGTLNPAVVANVKAVERDGDAILFWTGTAWVAEV